MPSPSKLTENQWRRLHERLLAGESARALAREAGITEAAVRKRFGAMGTLVAQSTKVRAAAKALADGQQALAAGERAIAALPLAHRSVAISLAERLANVSTNLAAAAELGSATAHRLHAIANAEAQRIDDADPTANPEALRAVAALTATANAASSLPLGLLSANRGTAAGRLQEGAGPKSGVLVVPGTMDEAAWEAMARSAASEQQPSEG